MSNQLTGAIRKGVPTGQNRPGWHSDNRLARARRRRARRDMIRQRYYDFQQLGYWISMKIFTARWRTVIRTMSDPSSETEGKAMNNPSNYRPSCYGCGEQADWLAPDGRCGDCTRLTPEEVVGDE